MNHNTKVSLNSSYETWFHPWRPYCHRKHASSVCIEHSNMQSWWSALSFCINCWFSGPPSTWQSTVSYVYCIWSIYLVSAWSLGSLSNSLPFKLILDVCCFIMPLPRTVKILQLQVVALLTELLFHCRFPSVLPPVLHIPFRVCNCLKRWAANSIVFLVPMDLDVRLWHSIGPLFHLSMHVSIRPGPFLLKLRLWGRD